MKIVGLMRVRNDAWSAKLAIEVAKKWCDEVLVLHHVTPSDVNERCDLVRQTHGAIVTSSPRVSLMNRVDEQWSEMQHLQEMLDQARRNGATHIAMIDADEILTANLVSHIRGFVENLKPGAMLQLPLLNLRGSIDRYHANGLWGDRIVSTAFLDHPVLHWSGDTFHAREPKGIRWTPYQPVAQGNGGVLHLWGANERRLRAKHALYKVTERLRWPDKPVAEIDYMYSQWKLVQETRNAHGCHSWAYNAVPDGWWHPELMQYLNVDAEPWQEGEVRRLVVTHGPETFRGLDLFGVA